MKISEHTGPLSDIKTELRIKKEVRKIKKVDLAPGQGVILWTVRIGRELIDKDRIVNHFSIDFSEPLLVNDEQEGHPHIYRRLKIYGGISGYYYIVESTYNSITEEDSGYIGQEGIIKLGTEKEQLIIDPNRHSEVSLLNLLEEQVLLNK